MGGWCQVPGAFPEMVLPLFFSNARFRFEPIQYIQHWFDPNPWKITFKGKKLPWLLLRFSGEGALKGIFFWKVVEHIPIPSGPNGIIFHQAARFPWFFLESFPYYSLPTLVARIWSRFSSLVPPKVTGGQKLRISIFQHDKGRRHSRHIEIPCSRSVRWPWYRPSNHDMLSEDFF